ncbi:ParB/RepB/Spo0J family partition protein [Thermosulfuriphilus sp.]
MKKRKPLGKGLDALLPSEEIFGPQPQENYFLCPLEAIRPNPYQPRKRLDEKALEGLAASIRQKGLIQPLVVREISPGAYELIAGERRWRAAQLAGLERVPVVIKDVSPAEVMELALIENIQRADLNPLEEAEAYARLIEEFGLTQEEVARRVGKDRSTIANFLRLLKLPEYLKEDLLEGRLSMGHTRALLAVDDPDRQRSLRDQAIKKGLSVRQLEQLIRREASRAAPRASEDPNLRALTEELSRILGSRVQIISGRKKGRLLIEFHSPEELSRIIDRLRSLGGEASWESI